MTRVASIEPIPDPALIEKTIARIPEIYSRFPLSDKPGWAAKGDAAIGQIRHAEIRRAIQMIESVNPEVAPWPTRSYEREREIWLRNSFGGPAIWKEKTLIDTKASRVKGKLGKWYLRNNGMGGLLDPPGRATHFWSIEYRGKYLGAGCAALEGMAKPDDQDREWIPVEVRTLARDLLKFFPGDHLDERWIRECYNYFRNCYSPDGENRNVGDCIIPKDQFQRELMRETPSWQVRHLAYLHIRKFDPQHQLREDLLS